MNDVAAALPAALTSGAAAIEATAGRQHRVGPLLDATAIGDDDLHDDDRRLTTAKSRGIIGV